jgi:hypothetical protein
MTKDQVKAVLERVSTWPADWRQELVGVAFEITAELVGAEYEATAGEAEAIEEGRGCERGGSAPVGVARAYPKQAVRQRFDKSPRKWSSRLHAYPSRITLASLGRSSLLALEKHRVAQMKISRISPDRWVRKGKPAF